ncbi:MAG: hypothetical protein KC503_07020 [Myxococcales bacterium]|nr:hypothetical protein [Myxococcales bacterium]
MIVAAAAALVLAGCPGGGTTTRGDSSAPVPDAPPGSCGVANCAGCCSGGVCYGGTETTRCGTTGALCVDCSAAGSCVSQRCSQCTPSCSGVVCGQGDGCGGACVAGSGCTPSACTPVCAGKPCGDADGCGSVCVAGSGCTSCTPSCADAICGAADGCGGTCAAGSGCCPSCPQFKTCRASNCVNDCSLSTFSDCATQQTLVIWYGPSVKISQAATACPQATHFAITVNGQFVNYYTAGGGTDFTVNCGQALFLE